MSNTSMCFLLGTPLSLVQILFLLGVRAAYLATLAWWQLLKLFINFHLDLFIHFVVWTVALLTFPLRILTCLHRERKLERLLTEMQIQMDALVWESKDLEDRLQIAYKDRQVIRTIFEEIEEEYEKALARIDLLENELHDLEEENGRLLTEGRGKSLPRWDNKIKAHGNKDENAVDALHPLTNYDQEPTPRSARPAANKKSGIIRHPCSLAPAAASRNFIIGDEMLLQRERGRVTALYRSLFSATLSILVGVIVREAEHPCPQLMAALFSAVGMSLCSVVRFFLTATATATAENKPASDAVALLSINCFLLGTLAPPTLPSVAAAFLGSASRRTR